MDRNFAHLTIGPGFQGSLSARRAWIEIDWAKAIFRYLGSLSARRAWIEIPRWPLDVLRIWSLSARRAWIEIVSFRGHGIWPRVALRKESVDRNPMTPFRQEPATVALRKESVDRNKAKAREEDM